MNTDLSIKNNLPYILYTVLCCIVLCCVVVLCCIVVLCCVVLLCVVLCCVVLCGVVLLFCVYCITLTARARNLLTSSWTCDVSVSGPCTGTEMLPLTVRSACAVGSSVFSDM